MICRLYLQLVTPLQQRQYRAVLIVYFKMHTTDCDQKAIGKSYSGLQCKKMLLFISATYCLSALAFAIPGPLHNPGISGLGFCNSGIENPVKLSMATDQAQRQRRSYWLHRPAYQLNTLAIIIRDIIRQAVQDYLSDLTLSMSIKDFQRG